MKKHLFLIGDIGIGKSSLIRKAILPVIRCFCGFYTQRVYKNETLIGFRMCLIENNDKYLLNSSAKGNDLFIYQKSDKSWNVDNQLFEKKFLEYTSNKNLSKRFILLDELGGFEMKNANIVERLFKILENENPVIGVMKAIKNKARMKNIIGVEDEEYFELNNYKKLYEYPDIELLNVTKDNKIEIFKKIKNWIKSNRVE